MKPEIVRRERVRTLCWSKLKHLLRSAKARTYADLNQAIATALDHINPDDAAGWFAHCGLFN